MTPSDEPATGSARASMLMDAARRLAAARDFPHLLQTAARVALEACPHAREAATYLLDEAGSVLQPCCSCAHDRVAGEWPSVRLDRDSRRELQRGNDVRVIRVGDSSEGTFAPQLHATSPLLVAPLHGPDVPLGMLCVRLDPDQDLDQEDAQRLGAIGAQASLALRWATAHVDPLARLFGATIEHLAQGLVILDQDRRIRYANAALRRLLLLSFTEADYPCPLSAPRCPHTLRVLVDPCGGDVVGPYSVSLDLPHRSPVTLHVLPSRLEGGGEARLVIDVTHERQEAETRAQFVSQVAHELRTPLQHIMGFASILADVPDLTDETRQRFLAHITEESNRLARLVEDLAELSRIENGRFTLDKRNVRVDDLLADIVARFAPGAVAKGLDLALQQVDQPTWAVTDRLRLEQIVSNLIENAVKFVPSGGTIRVSLDVSDTDMTIRVADTGPGIPSEALRRVFERYYRVPQEDGQVGSGMGLGLYISREIAHSLGGEIWVESEFGQGSTFCVRLPRR